jgi:hypothetical protein
MEPYLSCRMNPFMAMNGTGIPDGGNANYVVSDQLTYDDIACVTTNGFIIQTHATLPFSADVRGLADTGTDIRVNGIPFVNTGALNLESADHYPLGFLNSFASVETRPGILTTDPYNATTGRLVAVAHRLIYTGVSSTCSGTITITPNNVAYNPAGVRTADASLTIYNPDGSVNMLSGINTNLLSADYVASATAFTKDSVILRPEQGCYILPKHRSTDFKLIPLPQNAYAVVTNIDTNDATKNNIYTSLGTASRNGGIMWYDNDWSGYQIVVSGMQAGATFRFETAWCMEFSIAETSPFATFAFKASENRKAIIDAANAKVNAKASAVSADGATKDS